MGGLGGERSRTQTGLVIRPAYFNHYTIGSAMLVGEDNSDMT